MRLTTTFVLAMFLSLGLVGSALAQGTGRSLDIQPGAVQNGLGAAGVALCEDATGVTWWNPAGLGYVTKSSAAVSYAQLVPGLATDVSYNYATFVTPVSGWGAIGFGLVFLSYGASELTDVNGNVNGTFTSNEVSPSACWGTKVLPDLSIGASLKFIRIQLAPKTLSGVGSTIGFDVGALYKIPDARLKFGMNVQNLGPSVAFLNDDNKSPLSRNVKLGAAWETPKNDQLSSTIVADFNQSLVTPRFRTYNGGVEVKYTSLLAGRLGYYYDPLGQISGLTYGIGFSVSGLDINFGSIPQAKDSNLPNVSKITLGYSF